MHNTDLTRTILAISFIVGLTAASLWILRPFLPATLWAVMIVIATWPLMIKVQARLNNRRSLAVLVMTGLVVLVFALPLTMAITTIVQNVDLITAAAKSLSNVSTTPPDWLVRLPYIGAQAAQTWHNIAATGTQEFTSKAAPYAGVVAKWLLAEAGSFGMLFAHFLLMTALAAVMYTYGESAAASIKKFAHRLAGERGVQVTVTASQSIRAVALGVGVTTIIQTLLSGLGLVITGVPFAAVLTAVIFMLYIVQIGSVPVLLPAAIWLYWQGDTEWAIFLLVWMVIVTSLDNFLRPYLIKQGADLPMLLILAGVIGGLLSFGLVGIFVGPVVLAVSYTLLQAWVNEPHTLK
ncbi:MAG: AI-2E family transporter YdiK [Sulfuriferula sp.]